MGHDVLDTRDFTRFFCCSIDGFDGLIQRCTFRHGNTGHEESLIFVWYKRRWQYFVADAHETGHEDEEDGRVFKMADHPANFARIRVFPAVERIIEFPEEGPQRPTLYTLVIGL